VTGRNTNHYTITELESNVIVCNFQQFFVAPRCFPWPSAARPRLPAAPRGHSRLPAGGLPRLPVAICGSSWAFASPRGRLPAAARVHPRPSAAPCGHSRLLAAPHGCSWPSASPRDSPRLPAAIPGSPPPSASPHAPSPLQRSYGGADGDAAEGSAFMANLVHDVFILRTFVICACIRGGYAFE
jgi:hypothetical protein